MVTTANLDELRRLNFGRRALREAATPEVLARELARYDAGDAAAVSRRVRVGAARDAAVEELVALYAAVIAEQRSRSGTDPEEEARSAAACLQEYAGRYAEAEFVRGGFRRLLQVPLLGRAMRVQAAMQSADRALPQLLRILDAE
jgi:hypothetical protein